MKRSEALSVFQEFLAQYKDKKFVITTHGKADPDGLASAFALSKIFPKSELCVGEEMNEAARQLNGKLGVKPRELSSLNKGNYEGLVLVDTSSSTLVPEAKGWKLLLIIDHHQDTGRDLKAEFNIIDMHSPSTAELIAPLVGEIDSDTAFALCVAIISDGARFKSARANTFSTLGPLMEKSGRQYRDMLIIAEPEMKAEAKIAVLKAFSRVQTVFAGGYIIATSEVGSNESDAAALISEAADVAFVASWKDREQECRVSARARKHVHIPLNEVLAQVGKELGGAGGGHAKAAGASVKAHTEEVLQKCIDVFISRSA
ncbi:MAG: DHHA1 domain-containing protein [Candidatus Micrarchaeota archaeon]